MKRENLLIIIIFLLKRQQMVQGYCNQIVSQKPADNTSIPLQNEGNGTFSSFTIGFWLYYSPSAISTGWTELLRLTSSYGNNCGTDSRRAAFFYNWGPSKIMFEFINCGVATSDIWFTVILNASNSNEWFYFYASVNYGQTNQPTSSYFVEIYSATQLISYGSDGSYAPSSSTTMSYPGTTNIEYSNTYLYITSQISGSGKIGTIFDLIFMAGTYLGSSYSHLRNGIQATGLLSYQFNENSGQYVYNNYSEGINTAFLGSSSADSVNDPQRTTNNKGLIFSGDSIVTLPKLSSNDTWSISAWIMISQIQTCQASIFKRSSGVNTYIQLYLSPSTSNLMMTLNSITGIDLNINLGSSQWSFFAVSAEVYGNTQYIAYQTILYWPPTDMLTRSELQTSNVIWSLGSNDDSLLGDPLCSFIGSLKNFNYITGSSNFLINNENCDPTIRLSVGLQANYTYTLLYTAPCAVKQYLSAFLTCENCVDYNCQLCSNDTTCITCMTGYYLNPNGSCSTNCSNSYYADQISGNCLSCPIECSNCKNTSYCTLCTISHYLSVNHICLSICPDKTYANSISRICEDCDSTCLSCNGSTANDCLSCNSSYNLQLISLNLQNTCKCMDGYFPNPTSDTCSSKLLFLLRQYIN